jgi:polyferredoxin
LVKRRSDPHKLRQLRQIVQTGFLVVFSFLLVKATFGRTLGSWVPLLILTLSTATLTLVLGRVWCGWVCPLGTILYWTRRKEASGQPRLLSSRWWTVKYVLLLLVMAVAVLGSFEPAVEWMGKNPFVSGIAIAIVLAAIVGLNLIADLFWCRYLCPLGAALALLSRLSLMRRIVRVHCNDCSVCVDACPMGVVDPRRGFTNDPGECTVCIDCLTSCTSSSNGFRFSRPFGAQR